MEFSKDIQAALRHLKNGNTILYPTDTIWGIGCDASNEAAIDRVFHIKQRVKEKSLILLADSIDMVKQFVTLAPETEKLIASFDVPTTVIYAHPHGLPKNAVTAEDTVAIRIAAHKFCKELIKKLGAPLVSTSANISGVKHALYFEDISDEIKNAVDYIVPEIYDTSMYRNPSRLVKIHADQRIEYLR